jgi:chitin disaccharide deacetylase
MATIQCVAAAAQPTPINQLTSLNIRFMQDTQIKTSTKLSAPTSRKPIIICADDFGMSACIDDGILSLAHSGRLSAVSCMTQGPSLIDSAHSLAELPVDIGLHLNFTEWFGHGIFHMPLPRLIAACYLKTLPTSLVISQIHAQLDAFETCFERPPDFIDGHQHIHQLPVIREKIIEIIDQRYPEKNIWMRSTRPCAGSIPISSDRLKEFAIAILGARKTRDLAGTAGLRMNNHLLGVYGFSVNRTRYQDLLIQWFRKMQKGDLLMCHPASSIHIGDPIGLQRVREFSAFSDPMFPQWLNDEGLEVSRFSKL